MYSAEILADVRVHKHDLEKQFPGLDVTTRNAMLDRLVRDLCANPARSDTLVSAHGKKYTNHESLELLGKAIDQYWNL